ncbi:MAG: 5-dehydro-2-deoxygluconokinase [Geminicoccaceae bacterium]
MGLSEALARRSFVVIGRVGMDFYADPPGTRLQSARHFLPHIGGSSANIAVALVRQGAAASLVTSVSDDAVGGFCLESLDDYGVDRRHVRVVGGEARTSLAVVDVCGDNTQSVIYRNGAADFIMTREDVAEVDYTRFGALITTGTVLADEGSRDAAFHAFELARRAGLPLIFDIDYRPYSWTSAQVASETYSRAADMCDIIVGNDVEFGFMAGDYDRGLDKARELARERSRIVVYKMGPEGAVTITAEDEFRTGIYKSQALKPTGAGDAFMGSFIAGLADGRPLRDAVLRGSAAASIVVSRIGCAPAMPIREELDHFIASHPGLTDN